MNIVKNTIAGKKVIFESILDEVPGGVSLVVADLDYLTHNANVDKRYLPAGTPVYVDIADRTATVCKSTTALASSSAQAIRVPKLNHFKAGEILNDGVTSATITSVTTSVATYDTIAVDAALIYEAGTKYGEGSATGTSTALYLTPNGLTKDDVYLEEGNADVAVVTMGTAREAALSFPVNALYKAALRGGTSGTGTSLITFV
jgi:hypothetical protein